MVPSNRIQKVAIIGGSGNLGSHLVSALLSTKKHSVTALTRTTSTGTFPPSVNVVKVDYSSPSTLVPSLRGHDFLIIVLNFRVPDGTHSTIVKSAIDAGIPYIMPNCFGGDITRESNRKEDVTLVQAYANAMDVQELGGTYIAMTCGFWYEWSLGLGEQCFGFDIPGRKATFCGDGNTKLSTSTWAQCGRAVAALLSLPVEREEGCEGPVVEDWANGVVYVSSFCVSQRDMLESLCRVLGTKEEDWEVKYESCEKRIQDGDEEFKNGDLRGFAKQLYARNFQPGFMQFEEKSANCKLGLEQEDLDEATKRTLEMVESGWNPWYKGDK